MTYQPNDEATKRHNQLQEDAARALSKYLRISMRTARSKVKRPPFWLKRIYAMHQELTPEQRQRIEQRLNGGL